MLIEKRKQRMLGDGKNRLDRIQRSLYKDYTTNDVEVDKEQRADEVEKERAKPRSALTSMGIEGVTQREGKKRQQKRSFGGRR